MLERIVLIRLKRKTNCRADALQGGYQEEQDALTSCFVIDEVINHCCQDNDNVYVAYMDISKAFDTMWINGMLYKLYHNMGITGKMRRLIRNWYTNSERIGCRGWAIISCIRGSTGHEARWCSVTVAFFGVHERSYERT